MLSVPMKVRHTTEWDVPELPEKLKAAADASGKSVVQICREAEISTAFWYEVLKGRKDSITLPTLRAIEKAIGANFGVGDSDRISPSGEPEEDDAPIAPIAPESSASE